MNFQKIYLFLHLQRSFVWNWGGQVCPVMNQKESKQIRAHHRSNLRQINQESGCHHPPCYHSCLHLCANPQSNSQASHQHHLPSHGSNQGSQGKVYVLLIQAVFLRVSHNHKPGKLNDLQKWRKQTPNYSKIHIKCMSWVQMIKQIIDFTSEL